MMELKLQMRERGLHEERIGAGDKVVKERCMEIYKADRRKIEK